MKIAVIGGTGNISTSIVRLLLKQNHDVTCYNRGFSGTVPEGARHICGNRLDRDTFESTMLYEDFDVAIDMVCFNEQDAASDIRAFKNVSHFIQCSTAATYGVRFDYFPVDESHSLRPASNYAKGKVAADNCFLQAWYSKKFPVTIFKPCTIYSERVGLLRQVALEFSWIDRIRKGKPIVVSGDGKSLHQFLHTDDAAKAFCGMIGKRRICLGQTYNLVGREVINWEDYHCMAMRVLGREVELIGVPMADLIHIDAKRFEILNVFAHNHFYCSNKLLHHCPEFVPNISLEQGMRIVIDSMEQTGRIPSAETNVWEDLIIDAQRHTREVAVAAMPVQT